MIPERRRVNGTIRHSFAWKVCLLLAVLAIITLLCVARSCVVLVKASTSWSREWQGKVRVLPDSEGIVTPVSGSLTLLVQHGQWVSPGGIVAEIKLAEGGAHLLYAPSGGIVNLQVDSDSAGARGKIRRISDGDWLEAGTEVAGIIRPGKLCLILPCLPFGPLPQEYTSLELAEAKMGTAGLELFVVTSAQANEESLYLHLTDFPWRWLDIRNLEITLKAKGPEGYSLPKRSIVIRGNESGVFTICEGEVCFRKVEMVDAKRRQVLVRGLLGGERVMRYPRLAPLAQWFSWGHNTGRNR